MQVEGVASIVKNQALGVCLWSEWFGFQNRPSNGHWMVGGFQIYHPLLYLLSSFADNSDHPSIAWRFELTGRVEGTSLRLSNMMILQLMVIFFLGREIIQTQWFAFCPGTTFWSPGEWYWFRLRISEVEIWERPGSFEHRLFQQSIAPGCNCNRLWLKTGWGTGVWFMHWKVVVVKVVRVTLWWWKGGVFNIFKDVFVFFVQMGGSLAIQFLCCWTWRTEWPWGRVADCD